MKLKTRLTLRFYTCCYYLAFPIILARLLYKSKKTVAYRKRWNERFGYAPILPADTKSIWIHAVSVGEVIAAIPLVKAIRTNHPDYTIVMTTATPTGSDQVTKNLHNQVIHVYCPYDVPSCIKRFLIRIHPKLLIVMETEIWPNMLFGCHQRNIPIMQANARLSERSKKGYQKISSLIENVLSLYNVVVAQSAADGQRFIELGLKPQQLVVSGNIKFEFSVTAAALAASQALRKEWDIAQRPVWIAASTHAGEETILLHAFSLIRQKIPKLLFVLVPRHPERFSKVAQECKNNGYQIALRSQKQKPNANIDILLGDTMGELCLLYGASDVAFVGGSLLPIGGHNLIEPAAYGIPILSGPHLQNFTEVSQLLKNAGALQIVTDATSIATHTIRLLSSKKQQQDIRHRTQAVLQANRGAMEKHLRLVRKLLENTVLFTNTPQLAAGTKRRWGF
jgi:3-deoxy-D-manno-octulosonic-acid transferase